MIKKIFIFCALHGLFTLSFALEPQSIQKKTDTIFNAYQNSTKISHYQLPSPYNYLLTQPLMTKAIATYYQRTPRIETLFAIKNHQDNTYHRVIRMLVDSNKVRNDVNLAQQKNEAIVVELAFITMNFNELSQKIIHDVQNTNIPFGQLSLDNRIKIINQDRSYFTMKCSKELQALAVPLALPLVAAG